MVHSLSLVFLLCIPSAAGLAVLANPIVALVFEHGKFTAFDTMQTANALAAYAVGLAGYGAIKVLSPAFYALGDARTPMLISLCSIAVNYALNALLVTRFGHVGLAFSTSGVAMVNFLLLALIMRRRLGRLEGRKLATTAAKICTAAAAMALVAWLVDRSADTLPLDGLALSFSRVTAAIVLATLTFYAGCRLLHIEELNEAANAIGGRLRRLLRRR